MSRVVNKTTGEIALDGPDGKEVRAILTEEAVDAAEAALGFGLTGWLRRLDSYDLRRQEVVAVVWAGVNGHRSRNGQGKQITPERAAKIVKAAGGMWEAAAICVHMILGSEAAGLPASVDRGDEDDADGDEDDDGQPVDPTSGGASD